MRPAVGTRAHDVLAGAGVRGVPRVASEVAGDVTGDHVAVSSGVAVGRNLGSGAATRQRLFDAGLVTDTDHGELVAVPEEDEVHAWSVVSGDAEEATVVVVEVHLTGAGTAGVVGRGRGVGGGLPLHNPVVVEVVGAGRAGVETAAAARTTVRGVELEVVLVALVEVTHLAVKELGRAEQVRRADFGGQLNHLLCVTGVVDVVNKEPVGRRRGLRAGQRGRVPLVGVRGAGAVDVQVLIPPVVGHVVTRGDVSGLGLELALWAGGAARADRRRGNRGVAAVVDGVVQGWLVSARGVDTGAVGQAEEERALALDVRRDAVVLTEGRRRCVGVRTARVGQGEVVVRGTAGVGVGVDVLAGVGVGPRGSDERVVEGLRQADAGRTVEGGPDVTGLGRGRTGRRTGRVAEDCGLPAGAVVALREVDSGGVHSGDDHRPLGRAAVAAGQVGGADGAAAGGGAHAVAAVGLVVVVAAGWRAAGRGRCWTRCSAVLHDLDVEVNHAVREVGVVVADVFLVLDLVHGSTGWEGVAAREGELVPRGVEEIWTEGAAALSVVRVVVHVAVVAVVAVVVGDVAVTAAGARHAERGVKPEREDTLIVEQPRGLDRGGQEDHGALAHHEEGPEVGLFDARLDDHRSGNLGVQIAGFHVADLQVAVGLNEVGPDHDLAAVEGVAGREAHGFGKAEPVGALIEDGALADHEVLLHLEGVDFVVEVKAFRKGVADGVAAHRHLRGRRRRLEGGVAGAGFIHHNEHGVETRQDRIVPLAGLNHNTVGNFRREGGVEGVLDNFPTKGRGLQVEIDVTPRAIVVVVDGLVRDHLREGPVRVAEGLRVRISGAHDFAAVSEAVVHRFQFLGLREDIVFGNLVLLCRHDAVIDGVPHETRHRGQGHQQREQHGDADATHSGLLLVRHSQHCHSPHTDCMHCI